MSQYIIQDKKTKKYIAVDAPSGGFPAEVFKEKHARIWDDIAEAKAYHHAFEHSGGQNWELNEVTYNLKPINW